MSKMNAYWQDLRDKGLIPDPPPYNPEKDSYCQDGDAWLEKQGIKDIKELDKAMESDSPPF